MWCVVCDVRRFVVCGAILMNERKSSQNTEKEERNSGLRDCVPNQKTRMRKKCNCRYPMLGPNLLREQIPTQQRHRDHLTRVARPRTTLRSSRRPSYCSRLLLRAPVGFLQPIVFLQRHPQRRARAAHHGSPPNSRKPLRTRSASHPVSQSNVCSFYYCFQAFMVELLIANGALNAAARAFYDVHCRMQNESRERRFGHIRR